MCTGSYTEVHPQKPKLEGNKTVALYYQGVFFRKKKKLSAQGTLERRKGPLPSSPADFLCAFVAWGNECR